MFSYTCLLLALAPSAFANVFITSPTSSSTFNGGQQATISWIDDGKSPSLAQFGASSVAIYTGNAIQQTLLQMIAPSVNVATTAAVQFTPNPSIGPNGNDYFIRIQSLAFTDPANPTFPAEAFSSKFTLASMTGTFNASVQAQVNGQSTAPIGGPTASAGASTPPSAPTSKPATTSSHAASSSSAAAKPTSTNGASTLTVSAFGTILGVAAIFGITL